MLRYALIAAAVSVGFLLLNPYALFDFRTFWADFRYNTLVAGWRSGAASLELTGKNGGALEIKADLSLTAEQAYERLIKGE
mgnify:CR=1 FL=1